MKKRILIVDDDENVVHLLTLYLTDRDYEVIPARDGLSGVKLAVKYKPDLMILDIMMPRMSGYQTCQFLHQQKGFENLPIIFVTAKGQTTGEEYGMKMGGSAYMTKPIHFPELLENVMNLTKDWNPATIDRPAIDLTDPGIRWVG